MEKKSFTAKNGTKLNYILQGTGDAREKRPMIVYLHGMDGCGDDIDTVLNIESLASYIEEGKVLLPENALVLSPQCPDGMNWAKLKDEVTELIDAVMEEYNADEDRISLTGASLGGMGTFDIALAYPKRFACLVPVCASVKSEKCAVLTKMPVWIFHGELDTGMGFSVVEANAVINLAGGHSKLTMLPGEGHEIRWIYFSERFNTVNWMLSQRRK